jgi:hypothetical protein
MRASPPTTLPPAAANEDGREAVAMSQGAVVAADRARSAMADARLVDLESAATLMLTC